MESGHWTRNREKWHRRRSQLNTSGEKPTLHRLGNCLEEEGAISLLLPQYQPQVLLVSWDDKALVTVQNDFLHLPKLLT